MLWFIRKQIYSVKHVHSKRCEFCCYCFYILKQQRYQIYLFVSVRTTQRKHILRIFICCIHPMNVYKMYVSVYIYFVWNFQPDVIQLQPLFKLLKLTCINSSAIYMITVYVMSHKPKIRHATEVYFFCVGRIFRAIIIVKM